MYIFIYILLLLFGAAIGWILASSKHKKDEALLIDLKSNISAGENTVNELRKQIEQKDNLINDTRKNLESEQKARAIAETRLSEADKNIEEQKKLLEQAQEKLTTTFQALSGEALKSNNQAFLELAKESLSVILGKAKGDFDSKESAIKNLVQPLSDALQKYERQINELEKTRVSAYANLDSQIKSLISSGQQLQKETGNLVTALRRPEVRGRWGEITLKRVVELAGMSEHCDYIEQVSVSTEEGRLRPDMIIHLPNDREIVVDSKVSLDAYIDAIAQDTEEKKKNLLMKHTQQVKNHIKILSGKKYWEQFPKAPEFAVMFMPGESFLSAALENDPAIIEDGIAAKVIIATPTTLVALLRAVAYGWRQEQIAKNAQEIADLGKELHKRFETFMEHLNKTGNSLSQAVGNYNKMVSSLETRVMVSIRKFKELGASENKDLPEIASIECTPVKPQGEEDGN
ncbi:MAG: DNA recombination protein RmuC [bacterium]